MAALLDSSAVSAIANIKGMPKLMGYVLNSECCVVRGGWLQTDSEYHFFSESGSRMVLVQSVWGSRSAACVAASWGGAGRVRLQVAEKPRQLSDSPSPARSQAQPSV